MDRFLDYKSGRVCYSVQGEGLTVVLLHGFLEDKSIWLDLANELTDQYCVISIDLAGHGQSSNLSDVHSMIDMAQVVKHVLSELNIDKAIVAGHSMGGYVSLALAELYPELINGLALINSTPYPDTEVKKINRLRAVEAVEHNMKNFVSLAIPQLFAEGNRKKYADDIEALKEKAFQMDENGITAALKGMKDRPARDHLLRDGGFPVLLIVGQEDNVVDVNQLKELDTYDNIKVVELGGGHMSYIESLNDLSYHFTHFIENL